MTDIGKLVFQWVSADNVTPRKDNGWSVASPSDHGISIAPDIADAIATGNFVLMCKDFVAVARERAEAFAKGMAHLRENHGKRRPDFKLARAGETMYCRNGHEICDVTQDFRPGAKDWLDKVSNWRQPALLQWEIGEHGNVDDRLNREFCCARCDAPLYRPHLQRFYSGHDAWLAAEGWNEETIVSQTEQYFEAKALATPTARL